MIVPDINLLLYAYDSDSPFHSKAAAWWQRCLSGTESVGLAQVVIFGFVRIGTSGRVFRNRRGARPRLANTTGRADSGASGRSRGAGAQAVGDAWHGGKPRD